MKGECTKNSEVKCKSHDNLHTLSTVFDNDKTLFIIFMILFFFFATPPPKSMTIDQTATTTLYGLLLHFMTGSPTII